MSTTKDYITAKNNVQSVSYLLCAQVIKPQIIPQNTKSVLKQIYIKQNLHKHWTQNFRRISLFSITPVKKLIRLRHAATVDHSVDLCAQQGQQTQPSWNSQWQAYLSIYISLIYNWSDVFQVPQSWHVQECLHKMYKTETNFTKQRMKACVLTEV